MMLDTALTNTILVAEALEQGDLTRSVIRDYQGAFDQVARSLNNTVAKRSYGARIGKDLASDIDRLVVIFHRIKASIDEVAAVVTMNPPETT